MGHGTTYEGRGLFSRRRSILAAGFALLSASCAGDDRGGSGGDGGGEGVAPGDGDGDAFGTGGDTGGPGTGGLPQQPGDGDGTGGASTGGTSTGGTAACDSECSGVCVDTLSDNLNCGACGLVCEVNFACQVGSCVRIACEGELALCGEDCFDTTNDPDHCGMCGMACGATYVCEASACGCSESRTDCDGWCRDFDFDRQHCGACADAGGAACAPDEACLDGTCGTIDIPAETYCDDTASWDSNFTALEFEVLDIVNQRRAEGAYCGNDYFPPAPPLQMDASLRCAARMHSKDMEDRDFFDHTNPDGDGPGPRLAAAGYSGGGWGENIARGYGSPESVMEGWMESSGHCRNIMNEDSRLIGVGYYTGNTWTQTFGN